MSESILVTAGNLSRRCFDAKLGTMRKAQNFIVYPKGTAADANIAIIQSDKSIGTVDITTGKGRLYQGKGGSSPGFMHIAFGKHYDYPAEIVETIKKILG